MRERGREAEGERGEGGRERGGGERSGVKVCVVNGERRDIE